jgi:protein-ribulosamine 3-kinase
MGTAKELSAAIGETVAAQLRAEPASAVHGGCINRCYRWESSVGPLFVKLSSSEGREMLAAEADGLEALRQGDAVRVPRVLGLGSNESEAWIVLEWISFGHASADSEATLGERLARQHRISSQAFGWRRENFIGRTAQRNEWHADWPAFFRDRRLVRQLELAQKNGFGGKLLERGATLVDTFGEFFETYHPQPALLHGDLWGGNWAADEQGQPVLFDPAVYYGDREADLAMTRLFGGFGADFYSAYAAAWALETGSETRAKLYNLYHVLNHLNLFGGGYARQALGLIESLLAELGH